MYPIVSIIIPMYNAEKTLFITLESLLNQTYIDLELIFINDCSKDNSLQLLEDAKTDFENKGMQVKIISHEVNQGVACARNTGLDHATGEYIYYVDADDKIEEDAIALMVESALQADADIVGCDWFLSFEQNERKMNQPSFTSPWDAIEKMLSGTMRWNLWLFMAKRSLYEKHHIRFIPKMNMGEDLMVTIKLFTHAQNVKYIGRALYHYGQGNPESLTKVYSDRHIAEVTRNVEEVGYYLQQSSYKDQLGSLLDFLKLNIKLPLLISNRKEDYRKWLAWFPEANGKIMENKQLALRTRLLQFAAYKKWFLLLQIYDRLVTKVIYGMIYK